MEIHFFKKMFLPRSPKVLGQRGQQEDLWSLPSYVGCSIYSSGSGWTFLCPQPLTSPQITCRALTWDWPRSTRWLPWFWHEACCSSTVAHSRTEVIFLSSYSSSQLTLPKYCVETRKKVWGKKRLLDAGGKGIKLFKRGGGQTSTNHHLKFFCIFCSYLTLPNFDLHYKSMGVSSEDIIDKTQRRHPPLSKKPRWRGADPYACAIFSKKIQHKNT